MAGRSSNYRLLIYSHDTFGLGHLRRCRAIAHSFVAHRDDVSVLILSGSPIIGSYDFQPRVDFVRFPGVVKLRNGTYSPRGLDISIEDAIGIRKNLIRSSAEAFRPHVFLVDKEPLGLRGEVEPTLDLLKSRGTRLVLGLRDILDDTEHLAEEWNRKLVMPALTDLYDDIWVYGSDDIYDPLIGLNVPRGVRQKMTYTGYLVKDRPVSPARKPEDGATPWERFILVTTGGGGDGSSLIDWVLSAYEHDPAIPLPAYIVLGPFMPPAEQAAFRARADRLSNVRMDTFVPDLDRLMREAAAVVAMGGYNTFCEILAADKPSLIVPRTFPRLEQWIRAERMHRLGIVEMLVDDGVRDPALMAAAIAGLPTRRKPSLAARQGSLDGFGRINAILSASMPALSPIARELALSD
jgi:predicted glycosyltransferase